MDDHLGKFTYVLRSFANSPVERSLTLLITLDDSDDFPLEPTLYTVEDGVMSDRRGERPDRIGSGQVSINLFDGASNTGFLQIADAFDDMANMLEIVQQIAWSFAINYLRGNWARFVDPVRAHDEIDLAVKQIAEAEFGDRFSSAAQ
jgi:hypothetical protein